MEPQPRWSGKVDPSHVSKPTRSSYMNYLQAFRKTYRGPPVSCPLMGKMAADSWRSLSVQEKEPFVTIAKGAPLRRKTKRLQQARRSVAGARKMNPSKMRMRRTPRDTDSH